MGRHNKAPQTKFSIVDVQINFYCSTKIIIRSESIQEQRDQMPKLLICLELQIRCIWKAFDEKEWCKNGMQQKPAHVMEILCWMRWNKQIWLKHTMKYDIYCEKSVGMKKERIFFCETYRFKSIRMVASTCCYRRNHKRTMRHCLWMSFGFSSGLCII